MSSVKADEPHAAVLLGQLLERVRAIYDGPGWDGLRSPQFRLLTVLGDGGLTITALAERLSMTKQAAGQLVGPLAESGHVTVRTDDADRRVRQVRRTARGSALIAALDERIAAVEAEWAEVVGARRYATFRAVMIDIMAGRGAAE